MTYKYRLFGLYIKSDAPIPDLLPIDGPDVCDVTIVHASVPRPDGPEPTGLYVSPHGAILNIEKVGRFLIKDGTEVWVEPDPAATSRNVRLYLLGSAFGAILHQRGLLPLHANVIDVGDAAVAFMGHSGAGKSTLASWFHDRGFPVLGDDVCVVTQDEPGIPLVEPGLPRIRLWGDALVASGRTPGDYQASFDDMDKYDVPTALVASPRPLRLAAIYNMQSIERADATLIARLTGVNAVRALIANTYRGAFIPMFAGTKRHVDQCVTISRQVPVFELERRWGLDVFDDEAILIEQHVQRVLAEFRS